MDDQNIMHPFSEEELEQRIMARALADRQAVDAYSANLLRQHGIEPDPDTLHALRHNDDIVHNALLQERNETRSCVP